MKRSNTNVDKRLFPCPFCGRKNSLIIEANEHKPDRNWTATITCLECYATLTTKGFEWRKEAAEESVINTWNNRAEKAKKPQNKRTATKSTTVISFEDVYKKYIDPETKISRIPETDSAYIPRKSGIYIIRTPKDFKIMLRKDPDGTRIVDGKELPNEYDRAKEKLKHLKSNNADMTILYYGSATNLRERIKQYCKFGYAFKTKNGNPFEDHKGGNLLWYIKNNKKLLIEYVVTDNYTKEETERIDRYVKKYGEFPFANKINGKKK